MTTGASKPVADMPTLRSLADIAVPTPPSWTPQTIGWPILAALIAIGLIGFGWRAWRRYRANRYRREALAQLREWAAVLRVPGARDTDRAHALRQIAELLKRVALSAWPRHRVASLSGDDWAVLLRESLDGTGAQAEALDALSALVAHAEYQSDASLSHRWEVRDTRDEQGTQGKQGEQDRQDTSGVEALLGACRVWIERHHVPV
ncbi:DUF4381 domain-containing protein [Pandoraea capi]|nr:DUF4381 domain-containing protein [Pandoraea sp. LA3]MDN4586612.1 DUF4381 domain-containing protein [Pandoraea capi]